MNLSEQKQKGFTIVELLVVIVVIGILASISIVTYKGVQKRAAYTAAISDVSKATEIVESFEALQHTFPTSIEGCPTPGENEVCLKASNGGTWLYDAVKSSAAEPDVVIASINNRQFSLATIGGMEDSDEFIRVFNLAPIIDKYGLVKYQLDFDIKSADSSVDNTTQAYMQNGSGAKYSFYQNFNVTDSYEHKSTTFTPTLSNSSLQDSYLAFYGTYSTGNRPIVKNVKMSLAQ